MEYIKNTTKFRIEQDSAISLGKFDGLHRGHELLMERLLAKKAEGLKAVVFTFDIPPKKSVESDTTVKVLTTNEEKMHLFEKNEMDYLIECPFTEEIKTMEAEKFIEMMVQRLHVKYLAVGKDFHFGYNRRGDYKMLKRFSQVYGYQVDVIEKEMEDGREISSTFVREEILAGNMRKANQLLGYPYFVGGEILHGNQIGRTIKIPTINQVPPREKLLPPFGVYISRTWIRDRAYQGITNIGRKPTIQGENPLGVETHLFHFRKEIYGEYVRVELYDRIRAEQKFPSVEALQLQMQKDIGRAKEYFLEF